jgi:D-glycero-D-manno-heptose 1,7-bisphosphate phosphatase
MERCYHKEVAKQWAKGFSNRIETVFIDRDGVLNEKAPEGQYVARWDLFRVLPGVPEALAKLKQASIRVMVVSNQRGIALGLYSAADVEAIHQQLQRLLKPFGARVDAFYFCPHDKDQCNCRKPQPGLFEQAVAEFPSVTAATSVMIGDSLSDIEFGCCLGMSTILIEGDPATRKTGREKAAQVAGLRCASLSAAVDALLSYRMPPQNPVEKPER